MAYNKLSILVCGECRFVATLRESYRTNVAHNVSLVSLFEFPQMCMSIYKYVVCKGSAVLFVVYMSMCKEQSAPVVYNKSVISHYWKLQKHLIHLGITVAANGNNTFLHCVKPLYNALGIYTFGYAVAWSIVENVAEDEHHLAILFLIHSQHLLQSGQRAVYVAYY